MSYIKVDLNKIYENFPTINSKAISNFNDPKFSNVKLTEAWRISISKYIIDVRSGYNKSSTNQNLDNDPNYRFNITAKIATLIIIDSKCPDELKDDILNAIKKEYALIVWPLFLEMHGKFEEDLDIYGSSMNYDLQFYSESEPSIS